MRSRAAAVLAVLCAAGCSGHNTVVTVTTTVRSTGSGTLRDYLARVDRIRIGFDTARAHAAAALGGVDVKRPGATWTDAAGRLRTVAADYRDLAAQAAGIEAPPGLHAAHEGLAESLRLLAAYAGRLALALEQRDRGALAAALQDRALPRRALALRARWRAQLAVYARGAGVPLPAWARSP